MPNSAKASANSPQLSPQMEALFTAMAQNRSMAVLAGVDDKIKATSEQDETRTSNYLYDLFMEIHSGLFKDRKQGPVTPSAEAREELREALAELTVNGNGGKGAPALFNKDGYVIRHEDQGKLAESLAGFYDDMRKIKPFPFGNELTLDLFIVALTHLPSYREVYSEDKQLDFRRLNKDDVAVLHDPDSSRKELITAFKHALDPSLTPTPKNTEASFHAWPNKSLKVGGIPFLSHIKEDGTVCLVTVKGGLVPLDKIEAGLLAEIKSGKQFVDYHPIHDDKLAGYLLGTDFLRNKNRSDVDGIAVTKHTAPLFCLDLDILTGLRSHDKKELERLVKRVSGRDNVQLIELADNEKFRDRLVDATSDPHLQRTVQIAYEHLTRTKKKLKKYRDQILDAASSVDKGEQPVFIMSMGGAGSGKGFVKDVAQAETDHNFVRTSLDKFRENFKLHKLLVAAGHQSDDYFVIERPASILREMVTQKALEQRKNIEYDGTGIDYANRYDKIVANFKQHGYRTQVVAVDKPLPQAIQRVIDRYNEEKRALPWKVVIGKHVGAPRSYMAAVEDRNLDKISLFANDTKTPNPYLVAESFALRKDQVRKLKEHRSTHGLEKYMRELIYTHEDSILRNIARNHDDQEAMVQKMKKFREDNVAFMEYGAGDERRVLAIYNVERFRQFIEKGLMNPQASYEEGLFKTPTTLPHLAGLWQDKVRKSEAPESPDRPR